MSDVIIIPESVISVTVAFVGINVLLPIDKIGKIFDNNASKESTI